MAEKYITILGIFVKDLTFFSKSIPKAGQTVIGNNFNSGLGGKGTNQAIAAKRTGSKVTLISKIGNDSFGKEALNLLEKEKINKDSIFISDTMPTGSAGIFVNSKGENSIIVYPGASSSISKKNIDKIKKTIENSNIFLTQLELPIDLIKYCLQIAKIKKIKTILNPAPANMEAIRILHLCDIITPNIIEASELSNIKINNAEDIKKAGKVLLNYGVKEVIITNGEKGIIHFFKDKISYIKAENYGVTIDTTGAGDAFNGALASGINFGMNTLDACKYANAVAAMSVTKIGTTQAMPMQKEINLFWKRINEKKKYNY